MGACNTTPSRNSSPKNSVFSDINEELQKQVNKFDLEVNKTDKTHRTLIISSEKQLLEVTIAKLKHDILFNSSVNIELKEDKKPTLYLSRKLPRIFIRTTLYHSLYL